MKQFSWKDIVLAITILINMFVWYLAYSKHELKEQYWEVTGISMVFLFWTFTTRFEKVLIKIMATYSWFPEDPDDPAGGLSHDLFQMGRFFYVIFIFLLSLSLITKIFGLV